jgi:hypothetical protein
MSDETRPRQEFAEALGDWFVNEMSEPRSGPVLSRPPVLEHELDATSAGDAPEPGRRPRIAVAVAAVAIVAMLVGGLIVAGSRPDDAAAPSARPEPTDPPPPTTTVEESLGGPPVLPWAAAPIEAGSYQTDLLGVEMTLSVPQPLLLSVTRAGVVILDDGLSTELDALPDQSNGWTPDNVVEVAFLRVAGWSTRSESRLTGPKAASIDPYDLDGWIADNDVIVTTDGRLRIAGRTARVLDVMVDADTAVGATSCFEAYDPCLVPAAIAGVDEVVRTRPFLSAAVSHRIYLVPIDGSEPLAIIVTAPNGDDWFDTVHNEVIPSLELGPDAPPVGMD